MKYSNGRLPLAAKDVAPDFANLCMANHSDASVFSKCNFTDRSEELAKDVLPNQYSKVSLSHPIVLKNNIMNRYYPNKAVAKLLFAAFVFFASFLKAYSQTPATALNFDGSNDYVRIGNPTALQITGSLTLECQFRTSGPVGDYRTLISKWHTGGVSGRGAYSLLWTTSGGLGFWLQSSGTQFLACNSGQNYSDGNWHHVAGTWDGTTARLYVDGILVNSVVNNSFGSIENNSLTVAIGSDSAGINSQADRFFRGDIDEVRIWSRALCRGEILNNINCELSGSQTNLAAYYKLNNGFVNTNNAGLTTATDLSGNGNTGTLINIALTGSTSNWVTGNVTGTCSAFVPLTVSASSNSPVNQGSAINLSATASGTNAGVATYVWTGPNGFSSTTQNPSVSNAQTVNSGTYNITATANGCTATNSTAVTVNAAAGALDFDGVNDAVYASDANQLDFTSKYTIEAYIYVKGYQYGTIVAKFEDDNDNRGYMINLGETGDPTKLCVVHSQLGSWTNPIQWNTGFTPLLNTWYHIAVTFDGTLSNNNIKLYINGSLQAQTTWAYTLTPNVSRLYIGGYDGPGNGVNAGANSRFFKGIIDDLRMYNRPLCQDEITASMNCTLSGTEQGLVAYYKFNQGFVNANNSGVTTLTDVFGNTGALTNFALNSNTSNWVNGPAGLSNSACSAFTPLTVSASSNSPVNAGSAINLSATASGTNAGGATYAWTGPNSFSSTTQNPSVSNAQAVNGGIYNITATANGCSATGSAVVTVNAAAGALNFDGINDYVSINNTLGNFGTGDFTIEMNIKTTALTHYILSKRAVCGSGNFISMSISAGKVGAEIDNGSGGYIGIGGTISVNDGNWHHVALVRLSGKLMIYIDGALSATANNATANLNNSNILTLGTSVCAFTNGNTSFNGSMDEVRFWSRALCSDELTAHKSCELTVPQTGLLAYYKFNQGFVNANNSGVTTLVDSSGNGNNGTLTGFALSGALSNWITGNVTSGTSCSPYLAPEINVKAYGVTIVDGDNIASIVDSTDFSNTGVGVSKTRTFTIENTGTASLTISSITKTGSFPGDFVIGSFPSSIPAGSSGTFTVTFAPTAVGNRSCLININNNDCDEGIYDFSVQGLGATLATALNFDGVNDNITVPDNSTFDAIENGDAVTAEAWINISSSATGWFPIIDKYEATGDWGWSFLVNATTNSLYFDANSTQSVSQAFTFSRNTWYHVAVSYSKSLGVATFYVNGSIVGSPAFSGDILNTSGEPLYIGASPSGSDEYAMGTIDEVRVWSRALCQGEIQNNMNCELGGSQTGLVCYYKLNSGLVSVNNMAYTTAQDASGNGNIGTLNNFLLIGNSSNWTAGNVSGSCGVYTQSEINIKGNSVTIADGDNTPSSSDNTDFGNATVGMNVVKTYTIENSGPVNLTVSSVSITGTNSADYTVSGITLPATIAANASTTFTVTFIPSGVGVRSAVITVNNSDCDEPVYDFAVQGVGVCAAPTAYNVTGGGSYCAGGTGLSVGLSGSDTGVTYQLYNGASTVGSPVSGTGSTISFGSQVAAGVYTIIGTRTSGACTTAMNGNATVSINPLPTPTITAGGPTTFCQSGSVTLSSNGSSLSFDGVNDIMTTGVSTGTNPTFTMEFWINPQVVTNNIRIISSTGGTTNDASLWFNNGKIGFWSGCSAWQDVTTSTIPTNTWTHIAVVTNGTQVTGFVNGVQQQTITCSSIRYNNLALADNFLGFGTNYRGLIDEVRFWNITKTQAQIAANMNSSVPANSSGLLAYYKMDEGTGTTTANAVGSSNTGTLVNGTAWSNSSPLGSYASYMWTPGSATTSSITVNTSGNYSVTVTDANNCSATSAATTVTVNTPPAVFNVSGGGSYCAGGTGVAIGLNSSETGVNYQLKSGATNVGSPVAGTGSAISFGNQTTTGTYTVTATNATTNCTNNMNGSAVININALPTPTITAGGPTTFCQGGSVNLSAGGISSLDFNGTNGYVTIPHSSGQVATQMTMEAWVYVRSTTAGGANILMKGNYGYGIHLGNDGCSPGNKLGYWVNAGCGSTILSTGTVPFNQWVHVAVVVTTSPSQTLTFYINGVNAGSSTSSSITINNGGNGPLILGMQGTGCACNYFNGKMDEVRIWNTALTQAQIQANMNNSVSPSSANLQVYLRADNASGTTATDLSVNGTNGTLVNGMSWEVPSSSPIGSYTSFLWNPGGTTTSSITANATGNYTVTVTDANNCTGTSAATTVTANPLPVAYSVTGGGSYCTGSTGVAIGLNNSQTGVNYQLKNGATNVGSPVAGTGSAISFGNQTAAGTYTVVATNATTNCTSNMTGSAIVNINSLPNVAISPSTAAICLPGGSAVLSAASSGGIQLNGTSQYGQVPHNSLLSLTSSGTIEAWVNLTPTSDDQDIVDKNVSNSDAPNYRFFVKTNGTVGYYSTTGASVTTSSISWNTWTHVAVVFNAGNVSFYFNGVLKNTFTQALGATNSGVLYIGRDWLGRWINGKMDEVRIWNVARTQTQIAANMNSEIPTGSSGLVAYYKFNEGTGNTILDATGVNNGTLFNSPVRITSTPVSSGAPVTYLWSTTATTSSINATAAGSYTVTVTDTNGCSATSAPATVTINPLPTITCPASITVNNATGQCGAMVTYPAATASAGTNTPTITYSIASGSFFPIGTTPVKAYATDPCGNKDSCSFNVTVVDNTPPVLACGTGGSSPNLMRSVGSGGSASVVALASLNGASQWGSGLGSSCSDYWTPYGTLCDESPNANSQTINTKSNNNSGATWNNATNGIGVLVIDLGSVQTFNMAQIYQMFSDGKTTSFQGFYHSSTSSTPPAYNDPSWTAMFSETSVGAGVLSGNNVSSPTSATFSPVTSRYVMFYFKNNGTLGNGGYIEVRSVKLFNTNAGSNNIVASADSGQCTKNITYSVSATDNCPGTTVTYNPASGSAFPIGTSTVNVLATDASGNTATCSFTVTINAPEINIKGNGNTIADGDISPSTTDNTDFGGVLPSVTVTKTYTIENTGTSNLVVSNINVSGINASSFSVSGITLPATLAPNTSATYTVTFNETAVGIKTATATIITNDCDEAAYDYAVQGEITCSPALFTSCPSNISVSSANGMCSQVVNYSPVVTGTPAPNVTYTFSGATSGSGSGNGSGSIFNVGTTTVTINAVNPCSNVNCSFTVTITDNENPVITVPANIAVNNDAGICGAVVTYATPAGTDNCPGAATVQTAGLASGSIFPVGTTINTFTVTDAHGNTATASFTVSVTDNQNPVILAPANITVNNDAGSCGAIVTYTAPVGTDNCLGATTVQTTGLASGAMFPIGVTTNTFVVTDAYGNTATTSFTVTVTDNQVPVLSGVPANATVSCDNVPSPAIVTASDNCNTTLPVTYVQIITNGALPPSGLKGFWNFNENSGTTTADQTSFGNNGTLSSGVTWTPGQSGSAIQLPGTGNSYVNIPNSTSGVLDTRYSISMFAWYWPGTNGSQQNPIIQFNPSNWGCHLWQTGSNQLFVRFTQRNTLSFTNNLAANTLIPNQWNCVGATYDYATGTAKLWCNGVNVQTLFIGQMELSTNYPVRVGSVDFDGRRTNSKVDNVAIYDRALSATEIAQLCAVTCPQNYTITRTWSATDASNNTTTASQTITVKDTTAPVLTVPANIALNNAAGICGATATFQAAATDNCSNNITITYSQNPGTVFPVGLTNVTVTAKDECGNTSTGNFTVTVTDIENPVITAPANISVNNDSGICGAVVTYNAPVGTDNCPGSTTAQTAGLASGSTFPVGTTTNTFVVTDAHGNTATASFDVVVTDNENPLITAPVNISVNNDSGICGAVVTYITPVGTDNCPGSTTAQTGGLSSGSTFPVGTTTNTFVVTDAHGNTATASFDVVVTDNEQPGISIAGVTVNADNGSCAATNVNLGIPTTTDNCAVDSVWNNALTSYPVGITTVTWNVADIYGNTSNTTQTVTVVDNQAPIVVTNPLTVYLDVNGAASITASDINNASSDNCGIQSMSVSPNTFACSNVGNNIVVLTVNDIHGNTASNTAVVTVVDTVKPVVVCPPNITVSCLMQPSNAGTATATDACGISTIVFADASTYSANPANATHYNYVISRTWTATDNHGNSNSCTQQITVQQLHLTASVTNVACYNTATGSIDLTVQGGVGNLTYSWSNGATTQDISGLMLGTYSVTVTDSAGCTATATYNVTQPPLLTASPITASPNPTVAGHAMNTIYLGYGPQSVTLSSTIAGGTTPYTYSWTPIPGVASPTSASTSVSPIVTTMYTLTVIDAKGCMVSSSKTIYVQDVTANNNKVKVCHNGSTISISANAVPSHLAHGDKLGTCFEIEGIVSKVSCYGGNNGSVDISVAGSIAPYTYAWSNGATTEDVSGLMAGNYSVIVTSANGETASATFAVTQYTKIIIASNQYNVKCHGDSTGSVYLNVNGGNDPYTYLWNNGSTNKNRYGLPIGTYIVAVTDDNGCIVRDTTIITQPSSPLSISGNIVHVKCNGDETGAIDIAVAGGTAPYSYDWDDDNYSNNSHGHHSCNHYSNNHWCNHHNSRCSNHAQDLTNVDAGSYTVTVTDANGCEKTMTFTILEPSEILVTNTKTNVSCYNGNNGTIDLTVTGGVPPYTYMWNGGITTQDRTGLSAGIYTVTVKDSNNCTQTLSISISQPTMLATTYSKNNVSCNGGNNGSINLTVSGGTAPYTYAWSNSATTQDVSNLVAGTYTVTVTDSKGCSASLTVVISEPVQLTVSGVVTNVACNGDDDGAIDLTVTGGTAPYSYNWTYNGGGHTYHSCSSWWSSWCSSHNSWSSCHQHSQDISGLEAGSYVVVVTDSKGCSTTLTFNVSQPVAIAIAAIKSNVSCYGGNNGSITGVTVTGGTAPYSFKWNNNTTSPNRTGLIAGTYTLTVTDANGCTKSAIYTITQPYALTASTQVSNVSCYGSVNGAVNLSVVGGTAPYTYNWSNSAITQDITGLVAGTYTVSVTDSNGCSINRSATVSQPSLLAVNTTITHVSCYGDNDGEIDVTVTGGTAPYTYKWDNNMTSSDRTSLLAGSYSLHVKDANNCTQTVVVTVNQPSQINVTAVVTNVSCNNGNNGAINITATGGTAPYTYKWNNNATVEDRTGLSAGTYTVKVKDANGCEKQMNFTIVQPSAISASITVNPNPTVAGQSSNTIYKGYGPQTVTLTANVTGGTSGYTYSWYPTSGVSNPTSAVTNVTPAATTTYTLNITDANGCTKTVSKTVEVINVLNGDYIRICHNNTNISVPVSSVATHLAHGDDLGYCNSNCKTCPNENEVTQPVLAALSVKELNVYPNPSTGKFKVELPSNVKGGEAVIMDMAGKVLQKVRFMPDTQLVFDMDDVAKGVYIVQILNGSDTYRALVSIQN